MIDAGDFFEHALVHGDWKGTARQSVEPQLGAGMDVLLEIDWQGARQVREQVPDAVSIFILPPSRAALEERMRKRGQDSEAVMAQRLAAAREEMSHYGEFDYVIVNEHFDDGRRRHVRDLPRQPAAQGRPGRAPCAADHGAAGGRAVTRDNRTGRRSPAFGGTSGKQGSRVFTPGLSQAL